MIGRDLPEGETPEARAARLTLAFVQGIASEDQRAADAPAAEIIGALIGGFLRLTDASERLAASTEAAASHLATIANELKEARTFRERERRHGR